MCRLIKLFIYGSVVMTVALTSFPSQHPSVGVAYAQGAFGRRNTGSVDNNDQVAAEAQKKKDDARAAELKSRQEDDRQQSEQKRQVEDRQKELDARNAEATRRAEEDRAVAVSRQREGEQLKRDANLRQEQETRAAEDLRRREIVSRDSASSRQREENQREAELKQRRDQERRDAEDTRIAVERRAEAERGRIESGSRRRVDSTPTYRDEPRHTNSGKYDRVGERPRPKEYRHDYYPYDSNYMIYQPAVQPVIIYNPQLSSSDLDWYDDRVIITQDQPVWVIPSIYTVTADQNPIPRDADEALILIRRCWMEKSPALMWWLLPRNGYVDIVSDGIVTRRMKANDFYTLTYDAVNRVNTEVFWFRSVVQNGNTVVASGMHTYRELDGVVRRCDMTYTLALRSGRWVIVETGFSTIMTGSTVYRGLTSQETRLIFMNLSPMALFWGIPDRAICLGTLWAIPNY